MHARIIPQLCRLRFFSLVSRILSIRQPTRKDTPMARPNYQFKKRQKELAKKKKKEEKRQRKLGNKEVKTDEIEKDPTSSTENKEV